MSYSFDKIRRIDSRFLESSVSLNMETKELDMPLTTAQANYIWTNSVGCRYGITTIGAAYAFMDIVGQGQDGNDPLPGNNVIIPWLQNPNAAQFEPRWHDRLWNTCAIIVSFSPAGNVMLVSGAAGSAERYLFDDNNLNRGDGYSFRKCNSLPPGASILANITYGMGTPAPEQGELPAYKDGVNVTDDQVQELYGKIEAMLVTLAP